MSGPSPASAAARRRASSHPHRVHQHAPAALPTPPLPGHRGTPVARMVLGEENPDRHRPGNDKEHPPRPLGVVSGMAWEPREPLRSHVMHDLTWEFLEELESHPWIQSVCAKVIGMFVHGATKNDPPVPPDVADEPGSWKFDAIGDYGSGRPQQAKVAANILRSHPDLVITAGDNVYPTGRWTDYQSHWDPANLMGQVARTIPFMPSLGNHDMYHDDLRAYFGHFPYLQGRPYYAFEMKNAEFFSLDSEQDLRVGSAQYKWLEHELATSTKQWKVVYLHYPMYGKDINAYTEIRESVQPLLAKYGVQLLVAGHEHNYQRALPVEGVTHILTGGGGQMVYPFTGKQPAWIARRAAAFHHVEVSVGTHKLVVRAIDMDGNRIDTVEVPYTGPAQATSGAQKTKRTGKGKGAAASLRGPGHVKPGLAQIPTGPLPAQD